MKIRSLLHFFLFISAAILITGGGRLYKIDFLSLDAWMAVALVFALALNYQKQTLLLPSVSQLRNRIAQRPLIFISFIFGSLFLAHLIRFLTLNVHAYDAGFVYQSLFKAFSSPLLSCHVCFNESYLGEHSSFTLLLLGPITNLLGTPFAVPLLQSVLGFFCFWLLFRVYRNEIKKEHLAFIFFFLLCIRGIRESFIFDFREDLIGAVFYVLAFLTLRAKRPILALIPFLLAALSKETGAILLPFAMIGGLYANSSRPPRLLLMVYGAFSVSVFATVYFYILPHWTPSSGSGSELVKRLSYLGSSPSEIIQNFAFHPLDNISKIISHLATRDRFKYLFTIAAPITLIALRAFNPYYIPGFILIFGNLLSEAATQRMMQFHYDILLIPFFGFGLCESIRTLVSRQRIPRSFFTLSLLSALALSGTWPISHFREYSDDPSKISDVLWVRASLKKIFRDEVLLGDELTYPLLTDHESLRLSGAEKSGKSSLLISDARQAFLQKIDPRSELATHWTQIECGPHEVICRYEKR